MSSFRNFSLRVPPTFFVLAQKQSQEDDFVDCEKGAICDDGINQVDGNLQIETQQKDNTVETHNDESIIIAKEISLPEPDDDPSYLQIPPAKRAEFYTPHFVIDMAGIAY